MVDRYSQNETHNREYPRQARQVKASRAAVLPLSYCIHTTNWHNSPSVYAVSQQLLSQFVANLSLMSCRPAMVVACGVASRARRPPAKENYLTHITENYYYVR